MAGPKKMYRPNRAKASSQITRIAVSVFLIISAILIVLISLNGWSTSAGVKNSQIPLVLIEIVFALAIFFWAAGVLIPAAAVSAFLLVFSWLSLDSWAVRRTSDYIPDGSYLASSDASTVYGLLLIMIPVQIVIIVLAAIGSSQRWNTEKPAHIHRGAPDGHDAIAAG